MTPILVRLGTAALIGAASFANLPACAAKGAGHEGRPADPPWRAASSPLVRGRDVVRFPPGMAGGSPPAAAHPRAARSGGERKAASTSSRDLPRTA